MAAVTLITGAGSGIGRALALALPPLGYAIAALDLHTDPLRSLAAEIEQAGGRCAWAVGDVTDAAGLQESVRGLEAQLGPVDLLIASAGVGIETSGLDYRADDMAKVLNVNLLGVSHSIAAVLPGMVQRRRGHLVALSSVASVRGLPKMLAYCASKAGVNAIMDGLRVELKPVGVHVTTVCPGWVRTPMTAPLHGKLDHLMEVEEAAREIIWAIRTKAAYHMFPRGMRWRSLLLRLMPRRMQDRVIAKMLNRVKPPRREG